MTERREGGARKTILLDIPVGWKSDTLRTASEDLLEAGFGGSAQVVRRVADALELVEPIPPGVYSVRLVNTMDRVFAQWDGHYWRTAEGDVLSWPHLREDFAYLERMTS